MIKKTIYPKTERVKVSSENVCEITEKLDGSNLCIFKLNDKLHIAQRNNIYGIDEIDNMEVMKITYRGLLAWLYEHKDFLELELQDNSCLCGEWIGMGKLKYPIDEFEQRFYMFAKANVNPQMELYNFRYYHNVFIFPFKSQVIPNFIGVVPIAYKMGIVPDKGKLDKLYAEYCNKTKRNVEGFVVNYQDRISKYVRMKNGKLTDHFDRGE